MVGGPTFGPVIGSALTASSLGWRWTEYIEAIWVFFNTALGILFLPELYSPVLLARKARRMRKETGDSKYHHPHEEMKLDPKTIITKYFTRPMRMLVTEHMVTLIAFYASFVYGLLYMTLQVFPIVFVEMRGMSEVVGSLPFLAIFIGILGAVGINIANQHHYHLAVDRANGRAVPEARLPPVMVGGFLFCGGLFWFGWTASPAYHWILPCIAAAFIGAGFNTIFQQCINFLVDTYAVYAASAVAANTILRSIFAACLPFTVRPMFDALGVGKSMSILGAIAGCMIPVPFLFAKFGPSLRRRSNFAT